MWVQLRLYFIFALNVIMSKLHKGQYDVQKIEPKGGQRGLLCSNKASFRCPSLSYEQSKSSGNLNRAFDLLFEEVMRIRKIKKHINKNIFNKISST